MDQTVIAFREVVKSLYKKKGNKIFGLNISAIKDKMKFDHSIIAENIRTLCLQEGVKFKSVDHSLVIDELPAWVFPNSNSPISSMESLKKLFLKALAIVLSKRERNYLIRKNISVISDQMLRLDNRYIPPSEGFGQYLIKKWNAEIEKGEFVKVPLVALFVDAVLQLVKQYGFNELLGKNVSIINDRMKTLDDSYKRVENFSSTCRQYGVETRIEKISGAVISALPEWANLMSRGNNISSQGNLPLNSFQVERPTFVSKDLIQIVTSGNASLPAAHNMPLTPPGELFTPKRSIEPQEARAFYDENVGIPNYEEIDKLELKLDGTLHKSVSTIVQYGKWINLDVAVKIFCDNNEDNNCLAGMKKEVALLRQLRHPNIVNYYGVCSDLHAIVMEHFGTDLTSFIKREKNLSLSFVVTIATEIAKGMNFLHSRRPPLLHMDLKSSNILIKGSEVKIADFGISEPKHQNTVLRSTSGTYGWMAPEVLLHEPINEKADVYSFGIVLWQLTTANEDPYPNMIPAQIITQIVVFNKRPEFSEDSEETLKNLTECCWTKDPNKRPSFREISGSLANLPDYVKDITTPREDDAAVKKNTWDSVFGGHLQGQCPVCNIQLIQNTTHRFQCAHIISKKKGGPKQSWNLLPSCGCNQAYGDKNLIDYMCENIHTRTSLKKIFLQKFKIVVPPTRRGPLDVESLFKFMQRYYQPETLHKPENKEFVLLNEDDIQQLKV